MSDDYIDSPAAESANVRMTDTVGAAGRSASQLSLLSLPLLILPPAALLFWLLRPVDAAPEHQLREAASVSGFLLLISLSAGIAAMATVQFWKVLFRPRAAFHSAALSVRFGDHVGQVLGLEGPSAFDVPVAASPTTPMSSARRPPTVVTGSVSSETRYRDLLDNPTELVMGQIRSAADYILLRPTGYEGALRRLVGVAGREAVEAYLGAIRAPKMGAGLPHAATYSRADQSADTVVDDALVALRFFVEQHLNLVHIELSEGWRRRVRSVAVAVASSTGLLTIVLSEVGAMVKVSALLAAAIWGGFFSWLARDIAAWVERRRS